MEDREVGQEVGQEVEQHLSRDPRPFQEEYHRLLHPPSIQQ